MQPASLRVWLPEQRRSHAEHETTDAAAVLVRDGGDGKLTDGPPPFKLLGQEIVLFLDKDGKPAALEDRCCHRTAKLSKGWINGGNIVCGYHGWEYDRDGKLVNIPQFPFEQASPQRAGEVVSRQGALRLCLGVPGRTARRHSRAGLRGRPAFRRIHQFDDRWNTSALRLMENSFDNAHFAFVQRTRSETSTSRSRRNTRSSRPTMVSSPRQSSRCETRRPPRA